MSRRLPPLTALRAFEAAGRHMSFSKAARELNVTPAAISHQVKSLEEHLGVQLFRRLNRALLLTDAGQRLMPGLGGAFDGLAEALTRVHEDDSRGTLTASVTPAFASKWLVPRLERFYAAHPDLDVRISASMLPADFGRDAIDIAVRFGSGLYPGMRVDKLVEEEAVPVCAPKLVKGARRLKSPADLAQAVLLHDDSLIADASAPDWRMWLKAAGIDGVDPFRGPRFSQSDHALQAAIDGAGVLLGRRSLAAQDLTEGRLVVPFELSLPVSFSYYVLSPEALADRPKVVAFRDWLLAEAAEDESKAA